MKFLDLGDFGEFWAGGVFIVRNGERSQLARIVGILYIRAENGTCKRVEDLGQWGLKFSQAKEYGPRWLRARAELFVKVPKGADPTDMKNWLCFELRPPMGGK